MFADDLHFLKRNHMTCRRQCLPQCSLCPDFRYFRNEIVIDVRITFGDRDLNNYYDRNHLHESDIVRLVECGVHPYCEWLLETSISLWIRVGSEHIVNGIQRLSILFTVFVSFVRQLSEARNRRSESMPSWKEPIFFLWRKSKKSSLNTHTQNWNWESGDAGRTCRAQKSACCRYSPSLCIQLQLYV